MKWLQFPLTTLTLVVLLLSTACNSSNTKEAVSVPEANEATEEASVDQSEAVDDDSFSDAVNAAIAAAEAAQTAQLRTEWRNVSDLWTEAIALMSAVPEASDNYQVAQQKVSEYQPNLEYALSNSALDASCNSSNFKLYISDRTEGGKTHFSVNTNLPDDTEVMLTLSGHGYQGQSKVKVKDGKITSDGFSNKGNPLQGAYTFEVLSYFNEIWQAESLLQQLNTFESSCINTDQDAPGGAAQVLKVEVPFNIGDVEAAQQAIQNEQAEAMSIFEEAKTLLATGKQNLDALRQNPDAPACFRDLQNRMSQVDSLRNRADRLSQEWFNLKVAVNNLSMCSTCDEPSVAAYCSEAESFLREAEKSFSK